MVQYILEDNTVLVDSNNIEYIQVELGVEVEHKHIEFELLLVENLPRLMELLELNNLQVDFELNNLNFDLGLLFGLDFDLDFELEFEAEFVLDFGL